MQERLEEIGDRVHEVLMALAEPYDTFFKATEFWPMPLVLAVMAMPLLLHWLLPFKVAALISFVVLIPPTYVLAIVMALAIDITLRPPRR